MRAPRRSDRPCPGCGLAAARRIGAAILALAASAWAQEPAPPASKLRELRVVTRDVFEEDEAKHNLLYALVNFLHAVTREVVIRREAWFEPGDVVTDEQLAEYERNLRATRLFGEVHVRRVDNGDGSSDVVVDTRDRFTLLVSAGVSFVGGVDSYDFSIGERNLFGSGKGVALSARKEGDDSTYNLRYLDPQLFGSWHQLTLDFGGTDEGDAYGFDLRRPFKHLEDPVSYGVFGSTREIDVDYYQAGDVVASVPQDANRFGVFGLRAFGPRDLRRRIGLDVRAEHSSFEPTEGSDPELVPAPADYEELQTGILMGVDWEAEYRVLQGLDSLDYDEDVTLGASASLRTALAARDTEGIGTEQQPLVELDLRCAMEPARDTYATLEFSGGMRWEGSHLLAHRTRAAAHGYQRSLPAQTLALSLLYDSAEDDQGLPPQLTLGEDNGLRGYPARQFAGTRQVLLNLEDRWDTGLELWSVQFGVVGFFDTGWIEDPSQDLELAFDDALSSVGFGLRFGSSSLFGRRVFRLDVAWPLDEVAGESFSVSVSAAAGQIFQFFGNQTALSDEFGGFFR